MQELSLHLLDIVQNSITAQATCISIEVIADTGKDLLSIRIKDNGTGMDADMLERVTSPFTTTRTTRKVGLGIPMLKHSAEATGGSFSIVSALGQGTVVFAQYSLSHIDRAPMGDLSGTLISLVVGNPDLDWAFRMEVEGREYTFDTKAVRSILGADVPLTLPEVVGWIQSDIQEGVMSLNGGAL